MTQTKCQYRDPKPSGIHHNLEISYLLNMSKVAILSKKAFDFLVRLSLL
jgi:hypothetical protein